MTPAMDSNVESTVRERIRTCLEHGLAWRLGADVSAPNRGEGEVTRTLDRLDLVDAVEMDDDTTRYRFEATVHEEIADKGPPPAEPESRIVSLDGYIVLDGNIDLTFDERGRVRFDPGPVLHPRFWADGVPGDPPLSDAQLRNIETELASDTNPIRWRPGRRDTLVDDVAARLVDREEAMVLADSDAEHSSHEFVAAMEAVSRDLDVNNDLELPRGPYREGTAVFRRLEED